MVMPPSGTITFLFTDIEGSARRWEEQPEAMRVALSHHDAILREVIDERGGHVFKTVGDAVHAAFTSAPDALQAAIQAQRVLAAHDWGQAVRMALHTGTADERDGDYFGPTLNRLDRLRAGAHGGQILLSAVTAALLRDHLPDGVELRDLGVHRLRGLSEPERVFQAVVWGLPADFPPLVLAEGRPSTLPVPSTSLVGRETDIKQIVSLLGRRRLLTLTGPGGVGKTRLAIAVAERVHSDYADGAVFVDLSTIGDPVLVPATIVQVLGVRESEGRTDFEALQFFLREKRLLLVLDNFDQVVEAAPLVRDLLGASPGLHVLVTSRVVLRLSGEKEYLLSPLPIPDTAAAASLASLAAIPSVALFVARAGDVSRDFVLTNDNAAAVADICARLDGLPLAIELAAARTRMLTPEALRARLDQRLKVLVGGARDLPARQRTLRATIAWSYDLLAPSERAILRRLAVFAGGCTIESAAWVCTPEREAEGDLLESLTSLVENSLLLRRDGADGEPRFVMLETVREFAAEELARNGEDADARRRHADAVVALAEAAGPQMRTKDRGRWDRRLRAELGNIRAVLRWALDTGDAQRGLSIIGDTWLWYFRESASEGLRWAKDLLALPGAAERTAARAKALHGAGVFAWAQADAETMGPSLEESVAIWREIRDPEDLAFALSWVAMAWSLDPTTRLAAGEEALGLIRELDHRPGIAWTLHALALVSMGQGDLAAARRWVAEGLALCREVQDPWLLAMALSDAASLAMADGDAVAAQAHMEESLPLLRAIGDTHNLANVLRRMALLEQQKGEDRTPTLASLREALELHWRRGRAPYAVSCILGIAFELAERGEARRAAVLLGAVSAAVPPAGTAPWPELQAQSSDLESRVRAALEQADFTAAYEEGRALSLDAAVTLALAQTEEPTAPPIAPL